MEGGNGIPFTKDVSLDKSVLTIDDKPGGIRHAPGNANVQLTIDEIQSHLFDELHTPTIDDLYPHLWSVAKRGSDHIDALHLQIVKGRNITINEDANMHLIWSPQEIFVKPIPTLLLNHDIWALFLSSSVPPLQFTEKSGKSTGESVSNARNLALGFIGSYVHLIKHPSDFKIAQDRALLPNDITWPQWQMFISGFAHLKDNEVALRYHYGQLRLSRLNWAVRIFQPRSRVTSWFYTIPFWSISTYLRHMFAPLILLFAGASIILAAMQVMFAAGEDGHSHVAHFNTASTRLTAWTVCLIFILLVVLSLLLIVCIPLTVLVWQLQWGFRKRMHSTINPV